MNNKSKMAARNLFYFLLFTFCLCGTSCKVYTFHNVTIPADIKTIKINFLENKARYVNPQLAAQLTDALQQKISNETRLTRISGDNADYVISGAITGYSVSTAGISNSQTTQTNLTVSVHLTLMDNVHNKSQDFDMSRDFPFNASLTLTQAEPTLLPQIITNLRDDLFNRLFSNW